MARIYQLIPCLLIVAAAVVGCSRQDSSTDNGDAQPAKKQFLSMGTAPVGGAFPVVGGAIAEVMNEHKEAFDWKVQAKGTKGSQENIRRLQQDELELALSNAAISYFATRGEGTWTKEYDIRAIATMAPNVALFIARADSGIASIADLKGKRVITGPAGAGFQMFIEPILAEHGVAWDDIKSINATQSGSVDQLGDGSADAAFLGGAVPTGSITQATSTFDVQFVPFDEDKRQALIEKYAFFHPATIPAGVYKGLETDFQGLNVGSMHLITAASQPDDLIYEVTKTIWNNRAEIAGKHPAGKALNEKNITRDTGIDYHPGAVRFYQEAGLWPTSQADGETDAAAGDDESGAPDADKADADKADADKADADKADAATPSDS
jgi:hypothetical protein